MHLGISGKKRSSRPVSVFYVGDWKPLLLKKTTKMNQFKRNPNYFWFFFQLIV